MDAHQLLSDFQARGIRLIPEGGNLAVEPAERLSDADRVAIRRAKPELLRLLAPEVERVIEMVLAPASAPSVPARPIGLPPCPACGQSRYWISTTGKVVCASVTEEKKKRGFRGCVSAPRWQLTALTFHAIN